MAELKQCPFCGASAKADKHIADIGGGDYQHVFLVTCSNENCDVAPRVAVRGQTGYPSDRWPSDDEAEQSAIAAWNRRATDGQRAEPVAWFEADGSARGLSLREVLPSIVHSTRWHYQTERPKTTNPVWPVFAAAPTPPAGDAGQEPKCPRVDVVFVEGAAIVIERPAIAAGKGDAE